MNTSEYDKSIGMPDIDKEWAKGTESTFCLILE